MGVETIREVFSFLRDYSGVRAYAHVLAPWLSREGATLRDEIASLAAYGAWWRKTFVEGDLLQVAYALSRLSDVLLLSFQPPLRAGADLPFAHSLHMESDWPVVTQDEYLSVFTTLGMTVIDAGSFDPFFHEIVSVKQDDDPDMPITVTGIVWPGLMLGEMLFSRSGAHVRAGRAHAAAGVADQSTLNDTFLRRYRPTFDWSHGWGHNSQWRTDFRRDYLTSGAYHLCVDATEQISDDPSQRVSRLTQLTPAERVELVRHRCLLREPEDPEAGDPCPDWRLRVPRPQVVR
jgi:hypothetical protein